MKLLQLSTHRSLLRLTTRSIFPLVSLLTLTCLCPGRVRAEERQFPEFVPAALQVPAGQTLQFHATGVGVQIYVWTVNPTNAALSSWVFKAPHAVLFRADDLVGIHFAGPSWQGKDGSEVVGTKLDSVTVDTNAIPWLLLQASSNSGAGVFATTTYVQRLNTTGGLAPATPGTVAGQEVLVPYIADYFFYQAE